MTRRLTEKRIVVASHNRGKVVEIADLLRPFGITPVSAAELNLPEPEETEKTFKGNALLKARAAAKASGMPALSDDSGLAVAALNGDPGIYSARWAGPEKDFTLAMRKVEDALRASGSDDRSAKFVCALALVWPDGEEAVFEGKVTGKLVWPPRGENGFGYDPVFVADLQDVTFGEMDPAEKHTISHRADAFRQLLAACLS
ncbi:RdgB/HAM1 family non-canonical purine NTP pyrophosphatase [Minwuia sp.]|uniref:RdgB/HAM1 family non-canonical purine NTP pyrophosphatase n=1 Tax=Minwuia sp. TaxID=2493630 RepID=UPI003A8E6214